jgi:hypothetical protein
MQYDTTSAHSLCGFTPCGREKSSEGLHVQWYAWDGIAGGQGRDPHSRTDSAASVVPLNSQTNYKSIIYEKSNYTHTIIYYLDAALLASWIK